MAEHFLSPDKVHYKWNKNLRPAIEIDPGDVVTSETRDVTDGQVTPGCDASVLGTVNFDRIYPLAGPIYVKGARPGDALEVEILDLRTKGWGWNGILPGLGLLSEDFPGPYIRHWDLSNGKTTSPRKDIVMIFVDDTRCRPLHGARRGADDSIEDNVPKRRRPLWLFGACYNRATHGWEVGFGH